MFNLLNSVYQTCSRLSITDQWSFLCHLFDLLNYVQLSRMVCITSGYAPIDHIAPGCRQRASTCEMDIGETW